MKIYKSDQKIEIQFKLNGKSIEGTTYPRTLLSDFLRHSLGEKGTHVGCEHGICGACTVLLNNTSIRSCLMFAYQADNHELVTVEGLSQDKSYDDLRAAFKKYHALQCGFCTSGFLITIASFLKNNNNDITEKEIREMLSGNICRCTGYVGIIKAVKEVVYNRNYGK
jgi:aerobic-type carbon monoxide dehydrogenase small subunit (CoxS/CutS family)